MEKTTIIYMLAVAGIIAVGGTFTYYYYKKNGLKKTIEDYRHVVYQLMLTAEKNAVGGETKRLFVTNTLYAILPQRLKALFTIKELEIWIQLIYDNYVMDYLDDGELNNSYKNKTASS